MTERLEIKAYSIFTVNVLDDGSFEFTIDGCSRLLTKEQAKVVMIYLKEKLTPSSVDKLALAVKGYWICQCGLTHPKDFVCTML